MPDDAEGSFPSFTIPAPAGSFAEKVHCTFSLRSALGQAKKEQGVFYSEIVSCSGNKLIILIDSESHKINYSACIRAKSASAAIYPKPAQLPVATKILYKNSAFSVSPL